MEIQIISCLSRVCILAFGFNGMYAAGTIQAIRGSRLPIDTASETQHRIPVDYQCRNFKTAWAILLEKE